MYRSCTRLCDLQGLYAGLGFARNFNLRLAVEKYQLESASVKAPTLAKFLKPKILFKAMEVTFCIFRGIEYLDLWQFHGYLVNFRWA